jgi:hypothetical protein
MARPRRSRSGARAPKARRAGRMPPVVTIRGQGPRGLLKKDVTRAAPLERLAQEWAYVLRSRTRWADKPDIRRALRTRALDDLERAGVSRAFVRQLVSSRDAEGERPMVHHVEVELHRWNAADGEADRIHEAAADVPWEYLISAATRGEGRYRSLLVTRLLRKEAPAVVPAPKEMRLKDVLFIESAPGRLQDVYTFGTERTRIRAAVRADDDRAAGDGGTPPRRMEISETERVGDLKKTVRKRTWGVIHVTGVDTHQAPLYLDDLYDDPAIRKKIVDSAGRIRDGMICRDVNVPELPVSYEELARVLVNPQSPPDLVTLNLYHSGARTARELVRQGAHAALGFLDEIDDEVAEHFFQAFYWEWCRPGRETAVNDALLKAWQKIKGQGDRLHGTAIVMWMGHSVFPRSRQADGQPPAGREEGEGERRARLGDLSIGKLLQVELEVGEDQEVNYSLLHNDRPLLKKLTLTKLVKEPLEDITVQVELNLGGENYPYRYTHMVLDEAQLDVASMVRIPLTATLHRSLRERVSSTVYVKVTCGGRTAHETTERVTLIPVDEWLDDTDRNPWLPSFVLPRDPAILKIIASSRRYLVGIRDDPAAGFDGYQAVDPDAKDPAAGVDAQVRAIWTALVNEYRLQYINPPPSYSEQTQRLRTPSDILESNTATCIDLALLLASCLEYVDIYPVVVLLTGHAFVGYWRSEEAHAAFVEVRQIPAMVPAVGSEVAREAAVPFVNFYGWRLTRMNYEEIMGFVTAGDLVMLEATYLTSASSFADSIEEGRANMRSRREFDSLLDIRLARSATPPVTPLPVIFEG